MHARLREVINIKALRQVLDARICFEAPEHEIAWQDIRIDMRQLFQHNDGSRSPEVDYPAPQWMPSTRRLQSTGPIETRPMGFAVEPPKLHLKRHAEFDLTQLLLNPLSSQISIEQLQRNLPLQRATLGREPTSSLLLLTEHMCREIQDPPNSG
jgi:hypothetical protein